MILPQVAATRSGLLCIQVPNASLDADTKPIHNQRRSFWYRIHRKRGSSYFCNTGSSGTTAICDFNDARFRLLQS